MYLFYSNRHQKIHDTCSSRPAEYEQSISIELCTHSQTVAVERSCEALLSQDVKNGLFESRKDHLQTLQESVPHSNTHSIQHNNTNYLNMPSTSLSSKELTKNLAASCDVQNGRSEPHYEKLNYEEEVRNDASQNPIASSETYEVKSTSCIFDDPKYAASHPSEP